MLSGDGIAEPERRECATTGETVEARPGLREQRRVPAREHLHARAQLQALGAPCGEREADERIGCVTAHPLREPQGVEPTVLERVDELTEAMVVAQARNAEAEPDADLQSLAPRCSSYLP